MKPTDIPAAICLRAFPEAGMRSRSILMAALLLGGAALPALAQAGPQKPDRAKYIPHVQDPVLQQMEAADRKAEADAAAKTQAIQAQQDAFKKQEREARKDLSFDMSGIVKPASPADFKIQG
jgi:hypothetical protein